MLSAFVFPSAPCFAPEGTVAVCLAFGAITAAGEDIGLGVSSYLADTTAVDVGGSATDWNKEPKPIKTAIVARPITKTSHSWSFSLIHRPMSVTSQAVRIESEAALVDAKMGSSLLSDLHLPRSTTSYALSSK